jgi:dTDP-4-dehydrorhamnose reductase
MASALVLGSSGMVGRAVLSRLRELGVSVVGANRLGSDGGIAFDAADPPPLESLVAGADLVVNAVGLLRDEPDYPGTAYRLRAARVNSVFPLLLAAAAARQGTRVVHVSTDAVFASDSSPADEATEVSAPEPYGLSKALGEADAEQVVNVRCSVVGPAPGRSGLWEWLVSQPDGAEVPGHDTTWTGVTSRQLATLCSDLLDAGGFARVRAAGPTHHFVPNEPITKHELLRRLAARLRPDLRIVETPATPANRELVSSTGALDGVFTGSRGWETALPEAIDAG